MTNEEMGTIVSGLPGDQPAKLAAEFLSSLPAILDDCDNGVEEAERRWKELKTDPGGGSPWEQVRAEIGR